MRWFWSIVCGFQGPVYIIINILRILCSVVWCFLCILTLLNILYSDTGRVWLLNIVLNELVFILVDFDGPVGKNEHNNKNDLIWGLVSLGWVTRFTSVHSLIFIIVIANTLYFLAKRMLMAMPSGSFTLLCRDNGFWVVRAQMNGPTIFHQSVDHFSPDRVPNQANFTH